jgi:hypothetical protein
MLHIPCGISHWYQEQFCTQTMPTRLSKAALQNSNITRKCTQKPEGPELKPSSTIRRWRVPTGDWEKCRIEFWRKWIIVLRCSRCTSLWTGLRIRASSWKTNATLRLMTSYENPGKNKWTPPQWQCNRFTTEFSAKFRCQTLLQLRLP